MASFTTSDDKAIAELGRALGPDWQRVSAIDRPFAPPLEAVINLPFPPSTNQLWRSNRRRVHRSAAYQKWIQQADNFALMGAVHRQPAMPGYFMAEIHLSTSAGKGDIDNRVKAVLDWAQSRALVQDDKLCRRLTIEWVIPDQAPAGCKLILRSLA